MLKFAVRLGLCASLFFVATVPYAKDKPSAAPDAKLVTEALQSRQKVLGVNPFLWYAVADVFHFMPMRTMDALTGVYLSDWYVPSSDPKERIKVQVQIMSKILRSDALRIQVFRQKRASGTWVNAPVNPKTSAYLRDVVLRQARKLRLASGVKALN